MHLVSLQIGQPKAIPATGTGEWWDKEWKTGLNKTPVDCSVWLGYQGLKGDGVEAARFHGGVDKAVCAYPSEHYAHWREDLALDDFPHGAFGENFTTTGLFEDEICVGDVFRIGAARVQVSLPRQPCWKIGRRWQIEDFAALMQKSGKTGFYLRVLEHGFVGVGAGFELLERAFPQWTITTCNRIFYDGDAAESDLVALSECPVLAGVWRDVLYARSGRE